MKLFPFMFLALTLVGCASVSLPPDSVAHVPVKFHDTEGIKVNRAELVQIDGRLTLTGTAQMTRATTQTGGVHLDVQFFDESGHELALQTVAIWLSRTKFGSATSSPFAMRITDWPIGTAEIVVTPHHGSHPRSA